MENKTRRGFLKLLGKVAVVGGVTAIAPSTVLGSGSVTKHQFGNPSDFADPTKNIDLPSHTHLTEMIDWREEYANSAGKALGEEQDRLMSEALKAYAKDVEKNFNRVHGSWIRGLRLEVWTKPRRYRVA